MLTSTVKLKSFLVLLFPQLKINSTNSAIDAIADVTVVVANIQQFKFFLFQTQYKVPLAAEKLHKEGGGNRVLGVALKLTRLGLCSNY